MSSSPEEEQQQPQEEEGGRTEMQKAFIANQERRQRKPSGTSVANYTASPGPEAENPGPVPEFTGPTPVTEEQKKKKGIFGR